MTKETAKESEETAQAAPEPAKRRFVQYVHAPNRRALTAADLAGLGLEDREEIVWDVSNDWKVSEKDLNFPSELATRVFTLANGFRIVEE